MYVCDLDIDDIVNQLVLHFNNNTVYELANTIDNQ